MIGKAYLERGSPVTVLIRWRHGNYGRSQFADPEPPSCIRRVDRWGQDIAWHPAFPQKNVTGPRNVLVQRADGSRVVRPFRGLRRPCE